MAKVIRSEEVVPFRVVVYFRDPTFGNSQYKVITKLVKKNKGEEFGSGSDFSSYDYSVGFSGNKDAYRFIKNVLSHYKMKEQDRNILWFEVYEERVTSVKLKVISLNEPKNQSLSRGKSGYFSNRKTVVA